MIDRATIDFFRAEHQQAISSAFAAADAAPSIGIWGAWSAAAPTFAIRDIDAARRLVAIAEASLDRGRYWLALRRYMRGGLAMLEGDVEGGRRELREATRYMRECDVRLDLALGLLAIVELAPVDHPARPDAAAEARGIIEELGAVALSDLLDTALAAGPPALSVATAPYRVPRPAQRTR